MMANLKRNIQSGLTVAMVSLPLSISLSLASGAGPTAGVITSIWAGFFASLFGSSKYNIIGVAGALTSIIAAYILSFEQFSVSPEVFLATVPLLTLLTGVIIGLFAFFGLHKYFRYIPSSVMYGFAAGVALTIAMGQLKDIVNIVPPPSPHVIESFVFILQRLESAHLLSVFIFLASFFLMILWKKGIPQIPGVIPVAVGGIILGLVGKGGDLWGMSFSGAEIFQTMIVLSDRFPEEIRAILEYPIRGIFQAPDVSGYLALLQNPLYLRFLLFSATIIAFIAVLETIITAKLADKMTNSISHSRREVFGLSMGTFASGCAGGLPPSGVFLRTGLNVRSGAQGKTSGMLAAGFTALFAILFFPLFQFLPMAVVAAILFHTAIGLLELNKAKEFWQYDRKNFWVYLIVAAAVFFHDASIGVLLGGVLALLLFVESFAEGQHSFLYDDGTHHICEGHGSHLQLPKNAAGVFVYSFEGLLVYLNTQYHEENLRKVLKSSQIQTVILRFRHVFYIDFDGEEMLVNMIDALEKSGKTVMFTSISKHVHHILKSHPLLRQYLSSHTVHLTTREMLTTLGYPEKKSDDFSRQKRKKSSS